MTDLEIINTISTIESQNDPATVDSVYNHCATVMAKYDSEVVAQEIHGWEWEAVLLLLTDTHPEYQILAEEAQHRVADDIRLFYDS